MPTLSVETYDYIIVGAGSAGCVLADRLTACGRHKVLLIEAGGSDRRLTIKVPVGYGLTFADPAVNWRYRAQPDPGLADRTIYWPRGKVIGGSSSINAMAYMRGLPNDFEDWAVSGGPDWGWSDVERTFDRLETCRGLDEHGKPRVHGEGPLSVSDLRDRMHPFSEHFLNSARDVGWPTLATMDCAETEGLSYYRSTIRDGVRCSSADAFLSGARKRRNLRIVSHALATRLVAKDGRISEIRYRIGTVEASARADRDVILSAGAVNSPQLLQVSGIGPAETLKPHGLDVVHHLPEVGRGLQDHLAISHLFEATEPTLNNRLGRWSGLAKAVLEYGLSRRGPLSVPINQVGGFIRSDPERPAPDMQIFCNPATYTVLPSGTARMDREPGFLLSAQPCRPTSRGEVRIASADPRDPPLIHPNSLATEDDRHGAVTAGRMVRALATSPTLRRVTRAPKTPDIEPMSDDELLDDFRHRASTVFHPCCTCRMGADASNSVVDGRLRVHGMDGLRVVDASAFPNITSGNINAPTLMMALRAADMILEDARG